MSKGRDARNDKKPPDMGVEDGRVWFAKGQKPGPAGSAPGKRGGKGPADKGPVKGWARSWFGGGPTRGSSSTGRDRKGGWLLGGGEGRGPKGDE